MENQNIEDKPAIENKEEKTREIKISRNLIFGVIIGIVIVAVAFGVMKKGNLAESDVAALVNGEIITMSELNKAFDSLPQQYQGTVSKGSLLNQIVQAKVIYQEAEKNGLVVSNEEASQQFQLAKLSSGLSEEQFSANLVAQGTTEKELIDQYAKQLTVQKFIDENLLNKIQISDEEVKNYYADNPEQFKVDETVVVRHILIGDKNLSSEEQDAKAKELLPELTQKNFCEFAKNYSTDTASIPNCGEYTFTRKDALVEEFKNFSFKQRAGQMGIVRTQFGSHIIWTVKKTPARTLSLKEVSEKVQELLKTQKARNQYDDFYLNVSKNSKIEIKFSET